MSSMVYRDRVSVLKRAYSAARRNNELYTNLHDERAELKRKLEFASGIQRAAKVLHVEIVAGEQQWREGVLARIEQEIAQALAFVYPEDNYTIKLSSRILRDKIHVESYVQSVSLKKVSGKMRRTQGLLFRQIVSLAAVICIAKFQGVDTVYVDEAFSGASKRNMSKAQKLLEWYSSRGVHVVVIAQDPVIAGNLDANVLTLRRTLDNKTVISQEG